MSDWLRSHKTKIISIAVVAVLAMGIVTATSAARLLGLFLEPAPLTAISAWRQRLEEVALDPQFVDVELPDLSREEFNRLQRRLSVLQQP